MIANERRTMPAPVSRVFKWDCVVERNQTWRLAPNTFVVISVTQTKGAIDASAVLLPVDLSPETTLDAARLKPVVISATALCSPDGKWIRLPDDDEETTFFEPTMVGLGPGAVR